MIWNCQRIGENMKIGEPNVPNALLQVRSFVWDLPLENNRLLPLADLFPTYTPLDSLYAEYKVTETKTKNTMKSRKNS